MTAPTFVLHDPQPSAAEAPYTFFLPSPAEVEAVGVGDIVKLTFEYEHPTDVWTMERMWVVVEEAGDARLSGVLDSDPSEPTTSLRCGDRISFQRRHILAIFWADAHKAPPTDERREYWDRCLVDACVLDGTVPVGYLHREALHPQGDDEDYPDSGWRIHGRMELGAIDELQAREMRYVALGLVLNRDDSWLGLIDAPIGSRFLRDFEMGRYMAA